MGRKPPQPQHRKARQAPKNESEKKWRKVQTGAKSASPTSSDDDPTAGKEADAEPALTGAASELNPQGGGSSSSVPAGTKDSVGSDWVPTVSGLSRSMVVVEPEEFVDAESQPSAETPPDPILTGAASALNPGNAGTAESPEAEPRPTGAASVLNPGSADQSDGRDVAVSQELPPPQVRKETVAEEDELRPLSSALLAEAQGVKRSRTGGSRAASSTGSSWTLADLERLSSASTLQVPDSIAGSPPTLMPVCRALGALCREHAGDPAIAKVIRDLVISAKLWPCAVLPLNQMVERSQQLGDLIDRCDDLVVWLFNLSLDVGEGPKGEQIRAVELDFQGLLQAMVARRNAHEVLLSRVRENEFLETGSVRSTLSGLSTASKRARFAANRDLAEAERAQLEERARLEAYRSSAEGRAQEAMDRLRASDAGNVPVPGSVVSQLLADLPTEQSLPLASSASVIGSMSEATVQGSWIMEPSVGFSTAAASVPNPAVPHHRMDTPSVTEAELPSVAGDGSEASAAAPRELSPAASTVLIPDVASQPVAFGAVNLSDSGSEHGAQEPGESEQATGEQEGDEVAPSEPGVSEQASPISPRAAPEVVVSAPPPVPTPARSAPPPKAPSVIFKGPLKDLVNLADSASSVPQPVPRPSAVKSAGQQSKPKASVEFPSLPGSKPPTRTALGQVRPEEPRTASEEGRQLAQALRESLSGPGSGAGSTQPEDFWESGPSPSPASLEREVERMQRSSGSGSVGFAVNEESGPRLFQSAVFKMGAKSAPPFRAGAGVGGAPPQMPERAPPVSTRASVSTAAASEPKPAVPTGKDNPKSVSTGAASVLNPGPSGVVPRAFRTKPPSPGRDRSRSRSSSAIRKSRKQKRDQMAREIPSTREQPVSNKTGETFGSDRATWMQGADRLLSRPEVPLRVPTIGTPVHPRTVPSGVDTHTKVSEGTNTQWDDFTFGTVKRAPLGSLVAWLVSSWEYDQTLGALLAEEDFLRSGRIPARTITAVCGNIGSNLRAWRPGEYQWDDEKSMNPMRIELNDLARRAKGSKLSVDDAKLRTDLSKCLLAFRIQESLEGTKLAIWDVQWSTMEYQRIRKGAMREAPEIPRETRPELWRANIAGALRGIRGDLDLLVMQETPPEAVEFGYFHHLGLPYNEHWGRPFVASARTADAIRDGEHEWNPEMGRPGSRFVLLQKTGLLSSGNAGNMNLQVHASLVVNYRPLRPDAERNPGPPFWWGWVVSLHCRAVKAKTGYSHRNGVNCLYGLQHVLASLTQEEVLAADEFAELPEVQKNCVLDYMADLRNQFTDSCGGEEAFDLFVQQFKGYVAAQYMGDLVPGPDGRLRGASGIRFKRTTEEASHIYRWPAIEQCQKLTFEDLAYTEEGTQPLESWAAQSLHELRDRINEDHAVLEQQLEVIGGRNSSPLAFWRKHHPQYQEMDFEQDEWCSTPAHDALVDGAPPSSGITFNPDSKVVREPWCFRDRAFDEWFEENKERAEGIEQKDWEETAAANALNRLDPWRDYILPKSALSRLPPWDLVPGWEWRMVYSAEVEQVKENLRRAFEEDQQKMCPQGVRDPATLPPYRTDDPWYKLVPLPSGRLFNHVEAHVPEVGRTPKLELLSGDLNSMLHDLPGVRLLFELILRDYSLTMLPSTQKDMKPLRPPKKFWDQDMLEHAQEQWHEVRGFVDHGKDVGTQAFPWDDCSVAAVRIDRAVTYWSYAVDSMLYLLQDFRMIDALGWCRKGSKVIEGIHGLRAIQFHTPHTNQIAGLDRTNRRIPYIGNQAADGDEETLTLIDTAIARWDSRDKVKTFPELVSVVKKRYALSGLTFPSTISVEELEALERPEDVPVQAGKLRHRSHSERRGDKEPPRAKAQMPGARPTSGMPTGTAAASAPNPTGSGWSQSAAGRGAGRGRGKPTQQAPSQQGTAWFPAAARNENSSRYESASGRDQTWESRRNDWDSGPHAWSGGSWQRSRAQPPKRAPPAPPGPPPPRPEWSEPEEAPFRPAGPGFPEEPQVPPPRPKGTGSNRVPLGEPMFQSPPVLTKNPRPAYTRQWPEVRARQNLVKAEQLKIEYDFEAAAPGRPILYDHTNDFGFQGGLWHRAEQNRFNKIVSDYSLEVSVVPRWTDYKEMVQELRAEGLPETTIQERIRLLGRDWLQQESDERIELLIKDAESNMLNDMDMTQDMLKARIRDIRQAETSLVAKTEEEIRTERLVGSRAGRGKGQVPPYRGSGQRGWSR